MYYYFYKITNNINGHYYYGVHSTNNMNDGYMGSGIRLWEAYNKYGQENFTKTIFRYFTDENDMYEYERLIVNKDVLNDPNCYNLAIGGKGGTRGKHPWNYGNNNSYIWVSNEKDNAYIDKKHLPEYLSNGFKIGRNYTFRPTEAQRNKMAKTLRNAKWINNGKQSKFVQADEVPKYLANGWTIGRNVSRTEYMWINNSKQNKMVLKSEFPKWKDNGWVSGMKKKTN